MNLTHFLKASLPIYSDGGSVLPEEVTSWQHTVPSVPFDKTVLNQHILPGRRSQLCSFKLANKRHSSDKSLFSSTDFHLSPTHLLQKFPLGLERDFTSSPTEIHPV